MDTTNKGNQINMNGVPADLVFGLDIGTRSIVGTVGYKNREDRFIVVAQTAISHETRAMLDGQIHDIEKVTETIVKVKERLEEMTGRSYQDVCIAAAGRVLKTIEEEAEVAFATETIVTNEHVYSLDMLAVEKAHARLREQEGDETRFYCVGYSVKQYYQNDYPISNLEGHKCNNVKTELIATFLPDEVVDGLYAAVERAGLLVSNLTLEPIAAINVAIPERYRLLNIALVDVGAGTSDISITRDGSIIAYGMIPAAGDKFTECIAKHYLVDFQEADRLKCVSTVQEEVEFYDIMGLPMTVASTDVEEAVRETVQKVSKSVADKIIELNGDKTVSAVFVVGGGGKIRGFIESLAEYLDLPKERVALRGTEVLGGVTFMQDDIQVDSLLVTPIGICLNYYEQRNNFIFVYINEERIRLYDNNNLTVLDAALQVGLPNETLFPQKGDAVRYTVNGEQRMLRGEPGEAAVIRLNGAEAGINTPIDQGDVIEVVSSTKGESVTMEINMIPEYRSTLIYYVNGKQVTSPRLVAVNGELVSEYYEIQDGDKIEVLDYYTLEQVLEYMDVTVEGIAEVNNIPATADTKVYENFSVDFVIGDPKLRMDGPTEPVSTQVVEDSVSNLEGQEMSVENPADIPNVQETSVENSSGIPNEQANVVETPASSSDEQGNALETPASTLNEQGNALETPASTLNEQGNDAETLASTLNGQENVTETPESIPSGQESGGETPSSTLNGQENIAETPESIPNGQRISVENMNGKQETAPMGQTEEQATATPINIQNTTVAVETQPQTEVSNSSQTAVSNLSQTEVSNSPQQPGDIVVSAQPASSVQPSVFRVEQPVANQNQVTRTPVNGEGGMAITVNGDPVILRGKASYIMVDVLDFYPVDTAVAHGERLEIRKNGLECNFTEPLSAGDVVIMQWVD